MWTSTNIYKDNLFWEEFEWQDSLNLSIDEHISKN